MTAAEQTKLFRQALALPKKARLDLYNRLVQSLEVPEKKGKAVSGTRAVAEQTAVYGRKKTPHRAKKAIAKTEVLSKQEWNNAWKSELEQRIAEVESCKVKGIPYAEARKRWDKILGRT